MSYAQNIHMARPAPTAATAPADSCAPCRGPLVAAPVAAAVIGQTYPGIAAVAAGSGNSLMLLPVMPGPWKDPTVKTLGLARLTLDKTRALESAHGRPAARAEVHTVISATAWRLESV